MSPVSCSPNCLHAAALSKTNTTTNTKTNAKTNTKTSAKTNTKTNTKISAKTTTNTMNVLLSHAHLIASALPHSPAATGCIASQQTQLYTTLIW